MERSKKAGIVLILAIAIIGSFAACLRSNPESAEEKYGVLTLYEQGVSIKAPVADIEAYTHEKEIGKKEQLLNELLENPQNTVSYFEATPYEDSQEAKTIDVGE